MKNHIFHSFQCGVILTPKTISVKIFFTYLQNNRIKPSFFVCVQLDNVGKVTKFYSTEMKGTIFIY